MNEAGKELPRAGGAGGVRSVIVVPWHPHEPSEEESVGLESIRRYAGGAELVVAAPSATRLPPSIRPDRVELFPASGFETFLANNRLMTSAAFYERFAAYDQMVLLHCDVLLLKPLAPLVSERCPWSYMGAPWLIPQPDGSVLDEGVGNGGFSVRRIPDFLDALGGRHLPRWPRYTTLRRGAALWAFLLGCRLAGVSGERAAHILNGREILEDVFWAKVAQCLSPLFTVAPSQAALAFGYETCPAHAHRLNGGRLPYGVHAWKRHDAAFVRGLASGQGG